MKPCKVCGQLVCGCNKKEINTKHTQGKWRRDGAYIVSDSDCLIVSLEPEHYNDLSVYELNKKENDANARLIASAPELLEALKICLETISNKAIGTIDYMEGSTIYDDFENAANIAKKAISKSEGK